MYNFPAEIKYNENDASIFRDLTTYSSKLCASLRKSEGRKARNNIYISLKIGKVKKKNICIFNVSE